MKTMFGDTKYQTYALSQAILPTLLSRAFERNFYRGQKDHYRAPLFLGHSAKLIQLVGIVIRISCHAKIYK